MQMQDLKYGRRTTACRRNDITDRTRTVLIAKMTKAKGGKAHLNLQDVAAGIAACEDGEVILDGEVPVVNVVHLEDAAYHAEDGGATHVDVAADQEEAVAGA